MRPAVLRAGMLGGLALPDARGTRVEARDDGALVLVRRGGRPRLLAGPGEVTRVVVLPRAQTRARRFTPTATHGLVAFWADQRLVAVLSLRELFTVAHNLDTPDLCAAAGLDAVCERLGLGAEPPRAEDLARLTRVRQRHLVSMVDPSLRSRRPLLVGGLGAVLAFATWPLAGAWWAVLVATAVLALGVAGYWRRRRAFVRLVGDPLEPADRTVVRPAPAVPVPVLVASSTLQVGRRDVVLATAGAEWWLPGPDVDGVARCLVHPGHLLLTDRRGRLLLVLDPEVWGADLLAVLGDAGIEVVRRPEPYTGPAVAPGATRAHRAVTSAEDPDLTHGGGLLVTTLLHSGCWMLLGGSLATAYRFWPLGLLAPLAALVLIAMCVQAAWWHAGWRWALRAPADVRPALPGRS